MPVFLKYDSIQGDADEPAHRSWIDLTSVQFSPNKSKVSEITVTKTSDSASSDLVRESLGGQPVTAVIDFVRNDGTVYLRITMSEAMIASYQVSGGGDRALESLTLDFTKVEHENNPGTPPP